MATNHNKSKLYRTNRKIILDGSPPCSICGQLVCPFCNKVGSDSADHRLPVSKGGTHELGNLRAAHKCCNSSRGDRTRSHFGGGY